METSHLLATPLSTLVLDRPSAARVLRSRGLDYCCRGHRSLAEACQEQGLEAAAMVRELDALDIPTAGAIDWANAPLGRLIDHILARFHEPLKRELPDLLACARKVEVVHRERVDVPKGLGDHLEAMAEALLAHMQKEEAVLFPMIRAGHGALAGMPVRVMMQEHEEHAANLRRTRDLTNDLGAPTDACVTWRSVYARLDELERDLMDHVHLENHVLFPRALRERRD